MKKWLLTVCLGATFSMPMMASANEVNEMCQSLSEFAGEILDARKMGMSRSDALGIVRESVSDLRGEERQVVSELLNSLVNGVYGLSSSEISTSNPTEERIFKREFVRGFDEECRAELR